MIDDGGGVALHKIAEQEQVEARAIEPVAVCLEERSRVNDLVHRLFSSESQETTSIADSWQRHRPSDADLALWEPKISPNRSVPIRPILGAGLPAIAAELERT